MTRYQAGYHKKCAACERDIDLSDPQVACARLHYRKRGRGRFGPAKYYCSTCYSLGKVGA